MKQHLVIVAAVLLAACGRAALPGPVYPLTTTPDADFRRRPPEPAAHTGVWRELAITTRTMQNGMRVIVVEQPGTGLVSHLYVCSRAGKNPESYPADIAALTGDVLLQGFRLSSGEEVSATRVGGSMPYSHTWENGTALGLTVLREGSRAALRVLASAVQRPLLTEAGVAASKESQGSHLYDVSRTIGGLIGPLKAHLLFGAQHRFALDNLRWARELAAITTPEVRRYYQATYQPSVSSLIVVGDVIAEEEVLAAADAEFGPWLTVGTESAPQPRAKSLPPDQREHRVFAVLDGGSTTSITVLHPIDSPKQINVHAMGVLHQLIAGGYSSQLWRSLRHEAGLTYGVYGGVTHFADGGYLEIAASVPNAETPDTIEAIFDAIDAASMKAPSADALRAAKASYLATLQPVAGADLAWLLARLDAAGMPPEKLQSAAEAVRELTPSDILSTARTLSSDRAVALTLGNFYQYPRFASRRDVRQFEIRDAND